MKTEIEHAQEMCELRPDSHYWKLTLIAAKMRRDYMLKFKKDGKLLGILKDDADEPEGDVFNFKDEKIDDIKTPEELEEMTEGDNETVE